MTRPVHVPPGLILPAGTQVVLLTSIEAPAGYAAQPPGAVGVIVKSPVKPDSNRSYRVRFVDGLERQVRHDQLVMLAKFQQSQLTDQTADRDQLFQRVIYRCVIGSRAYGLDDEHSDIDYRGAYLPPADLHWSLGGVPEQLESDATQESYWELQKLIGLALKSNPNVLECLYTPLVELATPLAEELLSIRSCFLSKLVYQTFNGYVMSQFKKMQADIRNQGQVKWKHVMHLIRLLISGAHALREGQILVRVESHRDSLLAIKRGEVPWSETERWRRDLHVQLDEAFAATRLPERPDYDRANSFLIKARRAALSDELP